MYRLHLYLSEEIKNKLDLKARLTGKSKAELAREALEEGLKKTQNIKSDSAKALLNLAQMAEQLPSDPNDPKDLSINHNYYAWGGEKNE
jgi:predicted DNA-binding protein